MGRCWSWQLIQRVLTVMSTFKARYPLYYVVRDITGTYQPLVLPKGPGVLIDPVSATHQWLRMMFGGRYSLDVLCRIRDHALLSRPDLHLSGGACRAASVGTLTTVALEGAGIESSWRVLESTESPLLVYVSPSEDVYDAEVEVSRCPDTGRIMVQDYDDGLHVCPPSRVLLPSSEAEWLSVVLSRRLNGVVS